ncbi:MAG: glycosyltransferase family 2 protein [bacterium]
MTKPLLSICIPTYNRAQLLKQAVESVLRQIDESIIDEIEVIISDNASTDETYSIVQQIKDQSKAIIKYYLNKKNVGAESNFLLAVERASGQYACLLGSDDLLADGVLLRLVREIKKSDGIDIYYGEKEDFYLSPDQPMRYRPIMRYPQETIFDFKKKNTLDEYFKVNKRLIAYCNFISNVVFNRARWLQVRDKDKFIGTEYVHVYVFQSILWGEKPGVMKYLPWPMVKRRWGNDGPIDPGKRLRQDVSMFHMIANEVFTDKKYVHLIDDLVIRNDGFSWAVRLKINNPKRYLFKLLPFLFNIYSNHLLFWFKLVPLVFIPNYLLRFMRGLYRKQVKGEPLGMKELMVS